MITLIAAVSKNNVIGSDGKLPWHLPEDLKRFKELTTGKTVLMGRKTWESIPEKFRPLPNRTNIVITRRPDFSVPAGVESYASIDDALSTHATSDLFVIGGAEIYTQTMSRADALEITHVDKDVGGDTFFPTIDPLLWQETNRIDREGYSFVTYARRK